MTDEWAKDDPLEMQRHKERFALEEAKEAERKRQPASGNGNGLKPSSRHFPPDDETAYLNVTYGDIRREGYVATGDDRPIEPAERLAPIRIYTAGELQDEYPELHAPIIDGLIREREIVNFISVSKIGKSWLVGGLALAIVTGALWLGRFACRRGRVLIVDNELHRPTIAYRIKKIADEMGIRPDDYKDMLHILPCRGAGLDINAIGKRVESLDDQYEMLIIDAKYRTAPIGADENSNSAETAYYNAADEIVEKLGHPALGLVHHSTKGNQGERRITDVGAGGGAQSRAADTHVVLREHEDESIAVLEAAVRSFAPVEPMALRWQFPLWVPAESVDVQALKGRLSRGEERASQRDAEADAAVLKVCNGFKTRLEIRRATGFGDGRTDRAIARLVNQKLLDPGTEDRKRNPGCEVFRKSIYAS